MAVFTATYNFSNGSCAAKITSSAEIFIRPILKNLELCAFRLHRSLFFGGQNLLRMQFGHCITFRYVFQNYHFFSNPDVDIFISACLCLDNFYRSPFDFKPYSAKHFFKSLPKSMQTQ